MTFEVCPLRIHSFIGSGALPALRSCILIMHKTFLPIPLTVKKVTWFFSSLPLPGFVDPYSAYGNTRAFLDYRIMGFRECVAEVARYMTSVEGLDMKDPLRVRMLNHLENYLAQRELAINAAVAASAQMGLPKGPQAPTAITIPVTSVPYAPLTPPRASPDHFSPPANLSATEPLPRFNVAFQTPPIISFAPTTTMPAVFGAAPSGFKPVVPTGIANPTPLTVITSTLKAEQLEHNKTEQPQSPTTAKTSTKAPFRPWADDVNKS